MLTNPSIYNINNYALQDIFDYVAEHLLKQSKRSILDGVCLYNDEVYDLKCAVGCLISPREYAPGMEGVGVAKVLEHLNIPCNDQTLILLRQLQQCHDAHSVAFWKIQLGKIATFLSLNDNILLSWEWSELEQRYVQVQHAE